jgi:hypothetical protein
VRGHDSAAAAADNTRMEIPGRVHNGVVVLDGKTSLPEGSTVTAVYPGVQIWRKAGSKKRVKFPLVRSKHPGALELTNERIAEILEEENLASFRESFRQARS